MSLYNGARGRTRTDTRLPLSDFESDASTSFTTRAKLRLKFYFCEKKEKGETCSPKKKIISFYLF